MVGKVGEIDAGGGGDVRDDAREFRGLSSAAGTSDSAMKAAALAAVTTASLRTLLLMVMLLPR